MNGERRDRALLRRGLNGGWLCWGRTRLTSSDWDPWPGVPGGDCSARGGCRRSSTRDGCGGRRCLPTADFRQPKTPVSPEVPPAPQHNCRCRKTLSWSDPDASSAFSACRVTRGDPLATDGGAVGYDVISVSSNRPPPRESECRVTRRNTSGAGCQADPQAGTAVRPGRHQRRGPHRIVVLAELHRQLQYRLGHAIQAFSGCGWRGGSNRAGRPLSQALALHPSLRRGPERLILGIARRIPRPLVLPPAAPPARLAVAAPLTTRVVRQRRERLRAALTRENPLGHDCLRGLNPCSLP